MGRLSLLMTVVSRNLGEKYLKFYLEQQVEVQLVTLGRGTANDAMLDYFGLESHEKAVLFSVVDDQKWEELSVGLHRSMRIDVPGTGVAFLIPACEHRRKRHIYISDPYAGDRDAGDGEYTGK